MIAKTLTLIVVSLLGWPAAADDGRAVDEAPVAPVQSAPTLPAPALPAPALATLSRIWPESQVLEVEQIGQKYKVELLTRDGARLEVSVDAAGDKARALRALHEEGAREDEREGEREHEGREAHEARESEDEDDD